MCIDHYTHTAYSVSGFEGAHPVLDVDRVVPARVEGRTLRVVVARQTNGAGELGNRTSCSGKQIKH